MVLHADPTELTEYKDEGCEAFASCLSCPLPRCLEEQPAARKKWLKQARDRQVIDHWKKSANTAETARATGLSQRTVQRIVQSEAEGAARG